MKHTTSFGLGLLGTILGMGFADIDSVLPFLLHRSIVTHAIWFPLIACLLAIKSHDTKLRLFTIGFSVAMAVHLSFDLWPRAWMGTALIHVPYFGRMPERASQAWIAINMVLCLYLASWFVWKGRDFWLAGLSLVIPFVVYGQREPLVSPLLSCGVAVGIAFFLSEQETWMKEKVQGWTQTRSKHDEEQEEQAKQDQ